MAVKGNPHSPKLQHYWSLTIRWFSAISRIFIEWGWGLVICRDAVGVFYSPSQQNKLVVLALFNSQSFQILLNITVELFRDVYFLPFFLRYKVFSFLLGRIARNELIFFWQNLKRPESMSGSVFTWILQTEIPFVFLYFNSIICLNDKIFKFFSFNLLDLLFWLELIYRFLF